jgi:hypothetical protein
MYKKKFYSDGVKLAAMSPSLGQITANSDTFSTLILNLFHGERILLLEYRLTAMCYQDCNCRPAGSADQTQSRQRLQAKGDSEEMCMHKVGRTDLHS